MLMYRAGKRKERENGGQRSLRAAEEHRLFQGHCLSYCRREGINKEWDHGKRRMALKKAENCTLCPRGPVTYITQLLIQSLNFKSSLKTELQIVYHFWSKIVNALKSQFQNSWTWDTQDRLIINKHSLQTLCFHPFTKWRKYERLIHMTRIKITACTIKKSKWTQIQYLQ